MPVLNVKQETFENHQKWILVVVYINDYQKFCIVMSYIKLISFRKTGTKMSDEHFKK